MILRARGSLGFGRRWSGTGVVSAPVDPPVDPPAGDWTAPIGIPTPDWGGSIGNPILATAPTRPADWSVPVAGYYYIDGDTGSDSGRTYGTPSAPRKTIPLTLGAGAYVELHGTYTNAHAAGSAIQCNGTLEAPIWIRGLDNTTNRPTCTRSWSLKGSYCFLENLYWDSTGYANSTLLYFNTLAPADHFCLRSIEKRGYVADSDVDGGIQIGTTAAYSHSHIVCYQCNPHHFSIPNASGDYDNHCFSIGANASYVWIVDCEGSESSGDGVQINAESAANRASTHHIYIGRSAFHRNGQAGIAFKYAEDCIVSQNDVYDTVEAPWSISKGLGWQYDPRRIWFLFNTVHGCGRGIAGAGMNADAAGPIYALGNVIYDCHDQAIYPHGSSYDYDAGIHITTATDIHLHHNTIYDCDRGITCVGDVGVFDATNNIIAGRSLSVDAWDLYLGGAGLTETIQKNLISHASPVYQIGATTYDLAGFEDGAGRSGNVEGDPAFTNAAGADFTLQAGSPAVDAGSTPDAYATFQTAYGIAIAKDAAGHTRTGTWDIGAYERA